MVQMLHTHPVLPICWPEYEFPNFISKLLNQLKTLHRGFSFSY